MLTKEIEIGFKDVDIKQGIVKGQFCAHNVKDLGGDISEFGSLRKTILERGPEGKRLIKYCLNHEKKGLPGVLTELWEENQGGFYTAKAGSHFAGQDFVKMVDSGIINQHSFGYKPMKEVFDKAIGANLLKEIYLYEVSAIEFLGMNPNTTFIELKSLEDAIDQFNKLEKFIRKSDVTDETIKQLEQKLKSLSDYIAGQTTVEEKKADESKIKLETLTFSFESWKN
jgi:uncharacterized protein